MVALATLMIHYHRLQTPEVRVEIPDVQTKEAGHLGLAAAVVLPVDDSGTLSLHGVQ